MSKRPQSEMETAMSAAIARAFRSRAAVLRARAAAATTIINGSPPIVVITSEAAPLLRFASDWERIAAELEGGLI